MENESTVALDQYWDGDRLKPPRVFERLQLVQEEHTSPIVFASAGSEKAKVHCATVLSKPSQSIGDGVFRASMESSVLAIGCLRHESSKQRQVQRGPLQAVVESKCLNGERAETSPA